MSAAGTIGRTGLLALGFTAAATAGESSCAWEPVVPGVTPDSAVFALAVHDDGSGPALFAAGAFRTIGAAERRYIARYDGTAWEDVGGGVGFDVNALAVHDSGDGPALYAGGRFPTAGGAAANRIARWDGVAWSPLAEGLDGDVLALASYNGGDGAQLFAGGRFVTSGATAVPFLGAWDGASWAAVDGSTDGFVFSLGVVRQGFNVETQSTDTRLWVGGLFGQAGELTARNVAAWSGERWFTLSTGTSDIVRAITEFDDGTGLAPHIGGDFATANVPVFGIAKYQFTQFLDLDDGVLGDVLALARHDDGRGEALYVAGTFREAGPIRANRIARWDGADWEPLGAGLFGDVRALASFDGDLYAGGWFLNAGGVDTPYVARWRCASDRIFGNGFETIDAR
ncbi:MAG: hypothetical protein AAGE01_14655 [Pseudomonadota bacterium]